MINYPNESKVLTSNVVLQFTVSFASLQNSAKKIVCLWSWQNLLLCDGITSGSQSADRGDSIDKNTI